MTEEELIEISKRSGYDYQDIEAYNGKLNKEANNVVEEFTDQEIYDKDAESITLSALKTKLAIGERTYIAIEPDPSITNVPNVFWETNNSSIAYMISNGTIVALNKGDVTVTATDVNNPEIFGTLDFTVYDPNSTEDDGGDEGGDEPTPEPDPDPTPDPEPEPQPTPIPDSYTKPESVDDIPTENTEEVDIAIVNSDVINAMPSGKTFKNIIVEDVDINQTVNLSAVENLTIDNVTVSGGKDSSNGKVIYCSPDVVIRNITADPENTIYNAFEGDQTMSKPQLETLTAENIVIDSPSMSHNVINIYRPAEGAIITVKNSQFNLDVDNSNVLRLANRHNSKNVSVVFENVDWTYENAPASDWSWAGLVIYQPYNSDVAVSGDYSNISTWSFTFKNCRYNGELVTANNFGEHNQVVYMYNLNNTGEVSDPAGIFTINFENN
jgi:hypothetical protein